MPQERRHKSRRRRRGRFPGLYRLVSVVLILAAVLAALLIFFRVDEVRVTGSVRYTEEEIIEAAGIRTGDNLFAVNKSKVARELLFKLPYIQSVSIRRMLPDGFMISVTEGGAAAAVQSGSRWWLMGTTGKLLEETASPGNVAAVTGIAPLAPAPGTYLATGEEQQEKVETLKTLLAALEEHGLLQSTSAIDLTEEYDVVFQCDGRFTVHLSTTLERGMSYWLRRFAVYKDQPSVLEDKAYDVYIQDGEKVRFIPQ